MASGGNDVSRRTFAAAALTSFAAVRGTAANSAVKVGLIGAGGRGTRLASFVVKTPEARLVAICDLLTSKLSGRKAAFRSRTQGSTKTTTSCSRATSTR